ncbi:MAG: tRNA (N6-isopentenyl adenosine(37)-C2)-methylthiotransferase MiaB [Clostridia bacterium]|nr:tRNA (N6-isopentenyl adenosine(37)-C2)-methylthiotransferase MiaB [Clostridia bacterium]
MSDKKTQYITSEQMLVQREYTEKIRLRNELDARETGKKKRCYVRTFGCQQNEADSERLAGMASEMGYEITDSEQDADLILINTCAVREHAEERALSITGQFKHLKEKNPSLLIGICGCMVSQETRKERIKHSYPYVSFLFGTSMLYRFPEILYRCIQEQKRQFYLDAGDVGNIAEGMPVRRASDRQAWVSVMYGCNNFCTYCIVPYVRGRERSRHPSCILEECRQLIEQGYREITLLGQNVNSYGKDLSDDIRMDFPDLLAQICSLPGDFKVHFMTSHPKDASKKLINVMAENEKAAKHFHLPLQSGSDRVLSAMNRRYTIADYLEILRYMREKMPDITVTSDIIVGFPTETEAEFEDTLTAVAAAQYDQIFTFLYSPRTGTPAAVMEGQIPEKIKQSRMQRLLDLQNSILADRNRACIGRTYRILVEGRSRGDDAMYAGRTEGGKLVHFPVSEDEDLTGRIALVRITDAAIYHLSGERVSDTDVDEG